MRKSRINDANEVKTETSEVFKLTSRSGHRMPRRLIFGSFIFVFIFSLWFLVFGLAVAWAGVTGGFGVSPPGIDATHLVAGSRFQQTVYLVQGEPDQDLPIRLDLQIDEPARSWISFDPGAEFVIPAGTNQFPLIVIIQPPKDAGLGVFSGKIVIGSRPTTAGQITLALGAQISLSIQVGTGIYRSYTIPLVDLLDIEEGWSPRVMVKFFNDGNVPEKFERAAFDLYDRFDAVRLAYIQKTSDFPAFPPFTRETYTIEFPTEFYLGVGEYWGAVNFYKEGKVVAQQKTVFQALPKGSLAPSKFLGLKNYLGQYGLWPLAGIGIFILAGVYFGIRRLKNRPKSNL